MPSARRRFAAVFSASLTAYLAIGVAIPVLPRYVTDERGGGDLEVGVVVGAFAFAAVFARPLAGGLADRRGRRPVFAVGLAVIAASAALIPTLPGVWGLVVARLVLGLGDGMAATAGGAWTMELAPPDRQGQAIGAFGLSIWGGIALGTLLGEAAYSAAGYGAVWALAGALPVAGALLAVRLPETRPEVTPERRTLLPRAALRPGLSLALCDLGYVALVGFVVLHLEALGDDRGGLVFTAFAGAVVLTRVAAGWMPDRYGAARMAVVSAVLEAVGLAVIAAADGLALALVGALLVGTGFSTLYPSLVLLVVARVDPSRRATAIGAFSAFFDIGVGLGGPLAGAIAHAHGYPAVFYVAAALALAAAAVVRR